MSVRQIKGVWYWETMVNGRKYYGAFNGKDGEDVPRGKAEAKEMLSAIRRQIRAGTYGEKSDLADFSKFVDGLYLPFAREHHASPQHDEFRCEVLKKEFGKLKLKQITTMRVETFIKKRLESETVRVARDSEGEPLRKGGETVKKRRSPTTVRKEVVLISQIFNMAKAEKLVTENPCDFIRKAVKKKIPARRRRERAMTAAEEKLLVPQLAGRREHLLPVVRLALWTGMRRGEILRLEKRDLNFSDRPVEREVDGERYEVPPGWLFVERSKNGKPRSVPMCARVRAVLLDLCDDATTDRFIFENLRTGRAILDIKSGYAAAVKAAGISNLTFHDLRHTWSTRAEELGIPEAVRRDILGHSPGSMTASYTHSYREARERAVELVSTYAEARTGEDCVKNAERPSLWLASRTA